MFRPGGGVDENWDLAYWVIDGAGAFVAQHDQDNTANATKNTSISAIDINQSISHVTGGSHDNSQGQSGDAVRDGDVIYPEIEIVNATTISMTRGGNYNSIYYALETVDFSNSM